MHVGELHSLGVSIDGKHTTHMCQLKHLVVSSAYQGGTMDADGKRGRCATFLSPCWLDPLSSCLPTFKLMPDVLARQQAVPPDDQSIVHFIGWVIVESAISQLSQVLTVRPMFTTQSVGPFQGCQDMY